MPNDLPITYVFMVVQRNNKLLCFTNLHLYKAYMAIIPGCWNLTEMSETCIATCKHHINKHLKLWGEEWGPGTKKASWASD
ncbi:hypothetical protein ES288_D03G148100v1 [Gossypium darwinii]|uniref:Uncharacterized protein n=1 Tax=Gossypium darwinii TaxID=34276 RepID=A0A5D2D626_GOSDA|nr:hypothetical protein ES288_D03G148100v1 [Gossypium darwinii]